MKRPYFKNELETESVNGFTDLAIQDRVSGNLSVTQPLVTNSVIV